MSTATVLASSETLLTAEEFAALPDDRKTELVAGKVIVVPPPGFLHGTVQARIAGRLGDFLEGRELGHALIAAGVVTTRNPDTVRGPDVSFYSYARVPKDELPAVYPEVAPELVFEVRSPGSSLSAELRKVAEYLAAGTLRVCVVDPQRRTALLYGEESGVAMLTENDLLRLPAPLADWTPRVSELFPA